MKYTKEILDPVVQRSTSWAAVCRELGVKPMTGAQVHIKKRAVEFGIDFSHFLGARSNLGKSFPAARVTLAILDGYLVKGSTINSHRLKEYLWRLGLKPKACEDCGITEWRGKPAPLDLDHVNDDHFDNRLENLRIRCANCHRTK